MNVNSRAIQTVDGRMRNLSADLGRQTAALRKETAGQRKDLQSTREMAGLFPLLTPPPTVTLGSGATLQTATVTPSNMATLAPLLLLMSPDLSGGTSGGTSGDGLFGGGAMGLLLILALTKGLGN
jgi:hypothetical protein